MLPSACSRCGGRGWIVEDDGGQGAARPCDCRAETLQTRRFDAARVPLRYRSCRFDSFKTASPDPAVKAQLMEALAKCRRYVEAFVEPGGGFRESGLLLIGPPGGGKTHLAVATLTELIERYRLRGRFVELTSLFRQLQNTFDPGSPQSQREILDPVLEAELLVLDELGAQNPTPWVHDVLYLIINTRYTRRLPTLFTTNYRLEPAKKPPPRKAAGRSTGAARRHVPMEFDRTADEPPPPPAAESHRALLGHRLPPSLVSRLCEMAAPVLLDVADDYRRELLMHRHRV